jgi:hypothetical protein
MSLLFGRRFGVVVSVSECIVNPHHSQIPKPSSSQLIHFIPFHSTKCQLPDLDNQRLVDAHLIVHVVMPAAANLNKSVHHPALALNPNELVDV